MGIALISSCTKEESVDDMPYITFGVSELGVDTKALITNDILNSNPPVVKVYGVKNNQPFFNGVIIKKESDSSNWKPANNTSWENGSSYSFYGFTFSGGQSPASLSTQNDGMKIIVTQPSNYSELNMVDYMLSHAYKVADGKNNHIVMLYMQHAMSCAEIVVKKQVPDHMVALQSIRLTGIYRSATMECESQANANTGGNNLWKTQISGSTDVDYSKTAFAADQQNPLTLGTMTILAVPQQLTQEAILTITYSVDEDNDNSPEATIHTDDFKLFNYSPYVWESGHKIRYTLTINTGVELKAEILPWINAGYIEGVILPEKENSSPEQN